MRADIFTTLIDPWKDYDDNGSKEEHADFFHTFRRIVIEGTMDHKMIK
ncbi:hypothetical protein LIS82_26655 (plasmid) [Cytobacillus solani]|nr:hypothetical protein [Cytobacillus solani]USK57806.1 hypothetical protein LIS82_26655 [Cytobacillus solani]